MMNQFISRHYAEIIQGVIAISVTAVVLAHVWAHGDIPNGIDSAWGLIIGYFFGAKLSNGYHTRNDDSRARRRS